MKVGVVIMIVWNEARSGN